jgi:hypothetical protein
MAKVTAKDIKAALISIADGVLLNPETIEQHNAAKSMIVSVSCCTSFKTIGSTGLRYAVKFEQLGDYETANYINATLTEAF